MSNIIKAIDKFSPITADHNQQLKLLWLADSIRPWDTVYSREWSRPEYDFGIGRLCMEAKK